MALSYKEQLTHPNWQRKRLEIFQRDNFACTICGNTEHQLQVHHLYYLPEILAFKILTSKINTFDLIQIIGRT